MRDHHDRAFEGGQRFGQCFAHFQIKVVGRFVQQQHVRLLPGDQRQRQARALATGEAINRLECTIARKFHLPRKSRKDWFGASGRSRGSAPSAIGLRAAIPRVLGEVADLQVRCAMRSPTIGASSPTRVFTGGLARTVRAEQADALSRFQAEADVVQDHRVLAVTGLDVVQADQRERQLSAARTRCGTRARRAPLRCRPAGQALHAALRLRGLAGLRLEAVDEALQVGALGLFLLVRDLLLAQLFGALALEIGVAARVELGAAAVQVQVWVATLSRNSRSCEISSRVPGYFSSHCSSQYTASRSRWLVGSSSSSRSLGIISARARFRRTRQPPENEDTARWCVSAGKPRPCSSLPARASAS